MQCAWIENYLVIDTDGYTRPCCGETFEKSQISNIQNGILNSFNHSSLLELKNNLTHGFNEKTKPFCSRCEISEKKSNISLRTSTPFLSNKREIKKIQFKLSNKCQLACAHCGPNYSSKWAKILKIYPTIQNSNIITDKFLDELGSIFHQIDFLKFTGGEPFLDQTQWNLLKYLKKFNRKHCTLEYTTNGLIEPKYELWEGWKNVNCTVSVDGFENSYEWFRRGSSWNKLLTNVNKLSKNVETKISFALTPYTFQDYTKSKIFWNNYSFYAYPVIHPLHCNFFLFPKEQIKLLNNYLSIPYILDYSREKGNIKFYVNWANKWDEMWKTTGTAKKLFYWMN